MKDVLCREVVPFLESPLSEIIVRAPLIKVDVHGKSICGYACHVTHAQNTYHIKPCAHA